jgi:hypothetical protein
VSDIVKVALAIVTLGAIAVIVVNGSKTAAVFNSIAGGFGSSIGAAERG